MFHQHCQENLLGKCRFNPDTYAGPFSGREIEVRTETCVYRGNAYTTQPVIYGLDISTSDIVSDV
jgi:hypothetical protein